MALFPVFLAVLLLCAAMLFAEVGRRAVSGRHLEAALRVARDD